MWDLANRENWQLILTEERRVVKRTNNPDPVRIQYLYDPIPPIYTTAESHVVLIGCYSESALPHWFLGARVSQYLYVSPSLNSNLISGVQTSDIKRIGLNRLSLIKFEDYGIKPYTIQLEIPYWLEHIYIEAWEYDGGYRSESEWYEEMLSRLSDIENKIDDLNFQ